MKKLLFVLAVCFYAAAVQAQELSLPKDYLSKEFHAGRREALRKMMPDNSVMIIFANPEQYFSADQTFPFHQNPDFYYFTGYNEPEAAVIIFKEMQHNGDKTYNEVFFARKRDPLMETWHGRRLGVEGVQKQLGFQYVYNSDEFSNFPIDYSKFAHVIYDALPDDIGAGLLQNMYTTFKEKAHTGTGSNKTLVGVYRVLSSRASPSNLSNVVTYIKREMDNPDGEAVKTNPYVQQLLAQPDSATLVSVIADVKKNPLPELQYNNMVSALREIKTPEEMDLVRKTCFISAVAHKEVMKAVEPGISESEVDGIFRYVHRKYGAEGEGYPPIVGSGPNSCILHYEENNVTSVGNQLLLMDVASEYHGYSSDITRTVPANGKFTPEQKAIYQLVYDAQEAVFPLCKEGTVYASLQTKTTEVLANGLIKLGIIKDPKEVRRYYMHGVSHPIGLDVHDKQFSPLLKENMVITVEPGIYIPAGSPCDPKWWNIGVRIEDDVLIKKDQGELLSGVAPRKAEDVEKTMAEKSIFNSYPLPMLK